MSEEAWQTRALRAERRLAAVEALADEWERDWREAPTLDGQQGVILASRKGAARRIRAALNAEK